MSRNIQTILFMFLCIWGIMQFEALFINLILWLWACEMCLYAQIQETREERRVNEWVHGNIVRKSDYDCIPFATYRYTFIYYSFTVTLLLFLLFFCFIPCAMCWSESEMQKKNYIFYVTLTTKHFEIIFFIRLWLSIFCVYYCCAYKKGF